MAIKRSNHVVPSDSGWAVRKSGATRASRTFDTKPEAVEYGRKLSKSEETELYVHKKNGMVENKNSYSPQKDK